MSINGSISLLCLPASMNVSVVLVVWHIMALQSRFTCSGVWVPFPLLVGHHAKSNSNISLSLITPWWTNICIVAAWHRILQVTFQTTNIIMRRSRVFFWKAKLTISETARPTLEVKNRPSQERVPWNFLIVSLYLNYKHLPKQYIVLLRKPTTPPDKKKGRTWTFRAVASFPGHLGPWRLCSGKSANVLGVFLSTGRVKSRGASDSWLGGGWVML